MTQEARSFRFSAGARGSSSQLVRDVLEARGWTETTGGDWTIYWDVEIPDLDIARMSGPRQLLNRFPGVAAIGSKNWLHRTLTDARHRLEPYGLDRLLDVTPLTFSLPEEYGSWVEAASWDSDRLWIRKPKEGSRGHGVGLIESKAEITAETNLLVQEYVSRPRLIAGRKFTLRCYVLVTSIDPLVAYLHEDGFVKLASRAFSIAPAHRADRFRHLTNPDVLRDDPTMPASGDNSSHRAYRAQLHAEGLDADAVWESIRHTLAAALMAARGVMVRVQARNAPAATSFELLGCDVTLDENLRPLLLECNYAPSLSVEASPERPASAEEHHIKRRVLDDTMAIVEAGHLSTGRESAQLKPEERFRRELSSRGGFHPLVPSLTSLPLVPVFEQVGRADVDLLPLAMSAIAPHWCPNISPHVVSAVLDRQVVLGHRERRDLYVLNPVASAIWTGFEEGLAPAAIGLEIGALTGADPLRVEHDVWASLIEWTAAGLLFGTGANPTSFEEVCAPLPRIGWGVEGIYRVHDVTVAVRAPGEVLRQWIHPTLRGFETPETATVDLSIEAFRDRSGFELRSSCGVARRVREDGALAAELHLLIDRLALARRGVLFVFAAALEEGQAGTIVRLGGPPVAGRLLVRRDADGVARLVRGDGKPVNAVIYEWPAGPAEGLCRTVSPAEGLQRLLTDPGASPLVVDARAAQALAELAAGATWRVPSC